MILTSAGRLPSKTIVHVFMSSSAEVKNIVSSVLKLCEEKSFQSAAFPALGTGECVCRSVAVFSSGQQGSLRHRHPPVAVPIRKGRDQPGRRGGRHGGSCCRLCQAAAEIHQAGENRDLPAGDVGPLSQQHDEDAGRGSEEQKHQGRHQRYERFTPGLQTPNITFPLLLWPQMFQVPSAHFLDSGRRDLHCGPWFFRRRSLSRLCLSCAAKTRR